MGVVGMGVIEGGWGVERGGGGEKKGGGGFWVLGGFVMYVV